MTDSPLHISSLHSGGLIVTYACSSACEHCLYMCSPQRDHTYIDEDTARENFATVRQLGCRSMHIGGGEPFLQPEQLLKVLHIANEEGMYIEYIETNASWYSTHEQACIQLKKLKATGLDTLLISISPFHSEYIPFKKTKGLISACYDTGMHVFPWIQEFMPLINELGENTKHALNEYADVAGDDYIDYMVRTYGLTQGGRALGLYKKCGKDMSVEEILNSSSHGCGRLATTSHFHIDVYGFYVPGLCTGLAIERDDLGIPLDQEKYPVLSCLYSEGVAGLYNRAVREYNFTPADTYTSSCALCTDIRRHLAMDDATWTIDLSPREFYRDIDTYI